jgi:ACT domain-containing protein
MILAEKELELQIKNELLKKKDPTVEELKTIIRKSASKGMKVAHAAKIVGMSKSSYYYKPPFDNQRTEA